MIQLPASLAGVKAGAAQVEAAQTAAGQLRTYSEAGEPVEVNAPRTTRDRRA